MARARERKDPAFERLAGLAAKVLGAPMAIVTGDEHQTLAQVGSAEHLRGQRGEPLEGGVLSLARAGHGVPIGSPSHRVEGLENQGSRAIRMSTRSPRNGTPSASSRRRWRSPFASDPSARTIRCQGTLGSSLTDSTAPANRGAPGFVRAYGDVSPGAPRFAGAVLAACDDPDVPWHRIVRAAG